MHVTSQVVRVPVVPDAKWQKSVWIKQLHFSYTVSIFIMFTVVSPDPQLTEYIYRNVRTER